MSNHPLTPGWALYLRVSSEDLQHPEFSLPAQERAINERLVEPSGLPIIAQYHDVASAKQVAGRSEFLQMLEDAKTGAFSHVGIQSWERFGRNLVDALVAERDLRELGIRVWAADMAQIDVDTPGGWLTKTVRQTVAQWDNMQRSLLIRDRMQQRLNQGYWLWKAPDGYRNAREQITRKKHRTWIELDPDRVDLIQSIFRRYAGGGYTTYSLADELNSEGYRTAAGNPWSARAVHRCLLNPLYAGWCVSDKWGICVKGEHEALIDQATWDTCQEILHRQHRKPQPRRHLYPLGQVLWSKEVDTRMYNTTLRRPTAGWRAYHYTKEVWRGKRIYIPADHIEEQIPALLEEITVLPEEQEALRQQYVEYVNKTITKTRTEQIHRLRSQAQRLEREGANLLRLATKGLLADEEFAQTRVRINRELSNVKAKLQRYSHDDSVYIDRLDQALALLTRAADLWDRLETRDKKALAELIFKRITIDRAGSIVKADLWAPLAWLVEQAGSTTTPLGTPNKSVLVPANWPAPGFLPILERLLA